MSQVTTEQLLLQLVTEFKQLSKRLETIEETQSKMMQLQAAVLKSQMGASSAASPAASGSSDVDSARLEQTISKIQMAIANVVPMITKLDGKVEDTQRIMIRSVQKMETVILTGKAVEKTEEEIALSRPKKSAITIDDSMDRAPQESKKMSLDEMLRAGLKNS